jgi:hypothetical protein
MFQTKVVGTAKTKVVGTVKTKVVGTAKTQDLWSIMLSFFLNRAVYKIMWKNILEPGRPQMAIWRMRVVFIYLSTATGLTPGDSTNLHIN